MEYTYSAFISYRHLPKDIAAAKAVQRALETYRIPKDVQKKLGIKKLNRCFRDQDEMPLANDLGSSIEKALTESEWLIVICTPDLPGSTWCLREVDFFIKLGRKDKIIPVLVSGEPSESFPPQIIWKETEEGKEEIEPLAADLRGNLRKQLKTEKLRIAARMLNLNYNDLKKRERERELRRRLVFVSVILAAALCFSGYAIYKNSVLTEERNASARNATQLLIEKSVRSTSERDMGSGLIYALQAYDGSRIFGSEYDDDISAAIEAAMYPEPFSVIGTLKDNGILHRNATLSNDGKYISCRQSDSSLLVYDSVSGEKLYSIRDFGWFVKTTPDFSPDCKYVGKFTEDGLTLYYIADGKEAVSRTVPNGWSILCYGLTINNEVPLKNTADGTAALYDPFTEKLTAINGVALSGTDADSAVIHRSGSRMIWSDGNKSWIADTQTGDILLTLDEAAGGFSISGYGSLEYTDDSWYLRYYNGKEYVYLKWDTLEEVCTSKEYGVLSPDGKLLASPNGTDGFTLFSADTGKELWTEGYNTGNTLYGLAFADSDTLIASHEEFQIYRIHDKKVVYDSGSDRTTYGYDFAAGRLVMPLRAGGCLVNLLPDESGDIAEMKVETRDSYSPASLSGLTTVQALYGSFNGSYYSSDLSFSDAGGSGMHYEFEGKEYTINPINGVTTPFIYISPDGKWQAMIRGEEVDIFRAQEGPDPVMTIPGNGYTRLCAAIGGDTLALGSYVENLILYDLSTGECLGSIDTGAMCTKIQFSSDAKHVIAFSAMASQVTVAGTLNNASIMKIPVTDNLADLTVGFNNDATEAVVIYPDGHADVGLLYRDLDTLVEKAKKYTE